MIARVWRGATRTQHRDEYLQYLEATGLNVFRTSPGNVGAMCLMHSAGERTAVVVISFWESAAAANGFGGSDPLRAVFYPEDDRFLVTREEHVEHFSVVYQDPAPRRLS